MWPTPIELTGQHVTLAPLSFDHLADLQAASASGDMHKLWYTSVPSADGMEAEIGRRLGLQEAGSMLPFAVLLPTGRAVGMTTYMNIDAATKRVEIGSTWYAPEVQRSPLNTEAKRLLLSHAFDQLNCVAVEFRTHFMNHQSRRAIERLGAKLDGVLRSHTRMAGGSLRDTAVYSILSHEWPMVQAHLNWQLEKPRA
ncbi:GNAT family N-acetyltransferase [Phaeobacter sp. CNT1-3]|nr:GNAT family N-acetyltransferase [Phaeobacter sp. CNT1-3]